MVRPTMRVTCERCHVVFELRDDRVPPEGVKVQCTHCQHVFLARQSPALVLDRTERELLLSLMADLELLRHPPQEQFLGDEGTEPTAQHAAAPPQRSGLQEIANVRQVPGDSARRWFTSNDLDLIVWLGPSGQPWGFQLCYGKKDRNERAVTWWPERGLTHSAVDEGRRDPLTVKGVPVLNTAGAFDAVALRAQFEAASGDLPAQFREFVLERLR
jgi:predicted Zn finger-like uncharacterized protein